MEFRQALGMAIRDARIERGWSQDDLADAADTDRAYIGAVERGRRNPTLTTILRICAALDMRLSAIAGAAEVFGESDSSLRVAED